MKIHSKRYSNSFEDVSYIVNSLSSEEFRLLDAHGRLKDYKNSEYVVYRKVTLIDGVPVAFIEVSQYEDNLEDNSCNVALVTNPDFRGRGLARELLHDFIDNHSDEYSDVWYDFNEDNKASEKFVKSLPEFKYFAQEDDVIWYKLRK